MNKSKGKKIRRELDRLLKDNRFWEFLSLLEKEDMQQWYEKEKKLVWYTLTKRAVRSPSSLNEFLVRAEGLKDRPASQETAFLFRLGLFIEGKIDAAALHGEVPLQFPFNDLCRNAETLGHESVPERQAEKLLAPFFKKKLQVTKKRYNDLAVFLENTEYAETVATLGSQLDAVNKILRRPLSHSAAEDWQNIDEALAATMPSLPPTLHKILLYPFICKAHRYYVHVSQMSRLDEVARSVEKMPFLFPLVAGDKAEDIRLKCSGQGNSPGFSGQAIKSRAAALSLEEKCRMVRSIRKSDNKEALVALYCGIFQDIRSTLGALSEREKKELPLVVSSYLKKDLYFMWDDPRDAIPILTDAASTGCLDAGMAVAVFVISCYIQDDFLRKTALKSLAVLPTPNHDDFQWVFEHLNDFLLTDPRIIHHLYEQFGNMKIFRDLCRKQLEDHFDLLFQVQIINSLPFVRNLMNREKIGDTGENVRYMNLFRDMLNRVKEHEFFAELHESMECFPNNQVTEKTLYRYLNVIYRHRGFSGLVGRIGKFISFSNDMGLPFPLDLLPGVSGKSGIIPKAYQKFIMEHCEELETLNCENLDSIISFYIENEGSPDDLLRIYNIIDRRVQKGEKEFEQIKKDLYAILKKHIHPRNTSSRKKGK